MCVYVCVCAHTHVGAYYLHKFMELALMSTEKERQGDI